MQLQLLITCALALVGIVSARGARDARDKDAICEQVAPGSTAERHAGDECTLSCHVDGPHEFSHFIAHLEPGTRCNGGRCALGQCRNPRYRPEGVLSSYRIRIKDARVIGADEMSATASDPFVVVTVVRNGRYFAPGQHVCRTPTAWQKGSPQWNFACRPLVLDRNAVLKFSVHDMDAFSTSESLGDSEVRISDLARRGDSVLPLANAYRNIQSQSLSVSVTSRPFGMEPDESECDDV